MSEPTPGGVGEYLSSLGEVGLTSRHASFLFVMLQHEALVTCGLNGNAVEVTFPI